MPLLAAFLGTVLLSVVEFFAAWLTKAVAIRLALLTVTVGLMSTLWAAFEVLFGTITAAMPDTIAIPASWIMPGNAVACLSAYVGARFLMWAYHMDLWAMKLRAV